jgi:hypothetical protein
MIDFFEIKDNIPDLTTRRDGKCKLIFGGDAVKKRSSVLNLFLSKRDASQILHANSLLWSR